MQQIAYFQKADGVLLVFDLTDHESFQRAEEYWLKQVQEFVHESKRIFLVGNKSDLSQVKWEYQLRLEKLNMLMLWKLHKDIK